jgi:hypothetical protein
MKTRRHGFQILAICLFGLVMRPAKLPAQAFVVTTPSATELADEIETVIKSAALDHEPAGQTVLAVLKQLKLGAILTGLDRARGLSLAISFPKDSPQGGTPTAVLAVPVSNLGQLMDSLKALGLAVDDQPGVPGFSHKVVGPNGNPTTFVLESKGYALCTPIPVPVETLQAIDPASWRPKGRPDQALRVLIRPSEVPEPVKQQFLENMGVRNAKDRERRPGEPKAAYRSRMNGLDLAERFFKVLVREGKEIALELDVNKKTSRLTLEAAVSALPNTSMATTLRAMDGRRSRFQSLPQDSVAAAWGNFGMPNELRDMCLLEIDNQWKALLDKAPNADEKKALRRTAELLRAFLNQPALDLGAAIRHIKKPGGGDAHAVLLIGLKVPNGREFDQHLRDLAVVTKPLDKVKVTYDIAKGPGGAAIHKLSGIFDENDARVVKRFGKPSVFLAARDDAILVAFGEDGLQALEDALAKLSEPSAPVSVAPMAAVARLASMVNFIDPQNPQVGQIVAQVYPARSEKRDRMSIDLKERGEATVLHLAIDLPAIGLLRQVVPLMPR